MAIVKSKQAGNFTILPNELFKAKLSLESIGLLAYLLSLPPDWVLYKTTLHTHLGIGKHKLNTAFMELTNTGYIVTYKVIDEKTKQFAYKHFVYDKPQLEKPYTENLCTDEPIIEKPYTENPSTDNQMLNNIQYKETTNKETLTKDEVITQKQNAFAETLKPYLSLYGKEMLNNFFLYWTEPTKSGNKLRFDLQKTWDVARRLRTWNSNNFGNQKSTPIESTRDLTLGVLNL